MATRTAEAQWNGTLREGSGSFKTGSGAVSGAYSFPTRFEDKPGTNPEELIAAAHAACFSMALSAGLGKAGHTPESVNTTATITFEKLEAGWRIVRVHLNTVGKVPGLDQEGFRKAAEGAKTGCPISNALSPAIEVTLTATLA